MGLLRARRRQHSLQFALVWKGYANRAQVLANHPGILSLAARNILRQFLQCIVCWIKPVAEYIGRFASPRSTHLYRNQQWKLLLRRESLEQRGGIYTVMIGDSRQAKLFTHQVINQLFGHPGTITEDGMQLQVNRSIRSQPEMGSQCFQFLLLSGAVRFRECPRVSLTDISATDIITNLSRVVKE